MTKLTGKPASSAWQWGRTEQTRRALLDAARAVFTEQGFADASIAEVVERAGSSVGSLYHHFGGKSELFLTLWQEHQQAHEEAASHAVAAARQAGAADAAASAAGGAIAPPSPTPFTPSGFLGDRQSRWMVSIRGTPPALGSA